MWIGRFDYGFLFLKGTIRTNLGERLSHSWSFSKSVQLSGCPIPLGGVRSSSEPQNIIPSTTDEELLYDVKQKCPLQKRNKHSFWSI